MTAKIPKRPSSCHPKVRPSHAAGALAFGALARSCAPLRESKRCKFFIDLISFSLSSTRTLFPDHPAAKVPRTYAVKRCPTAPPWASRAPTCDRRPERGQKAASNHPAPRAPTQGARAQVCVDEQAHEHLLRRIATVAAWQRWPAIPQRPEQQRAVQRPQQRRYGDRSGATSDRSGRAPGGSRVDAPVALLLVLVP